MNCSAGMPPRAMRAGYTAFCHFPDPLGIVPAEVLDKLEFVSLCCSLLCQQEFSK